MFCIELGVMSSLYGNFENIQFVWNLEVFFNLYGNLELGNKNWYQIHVM